MTSTNQRVRLRRGIESIVDGPFGSNLASEHYVDDGARVVRLGNIRAMSFYDEDKAYIDLDHFAELRRHAVIGGDVLVAGLGDENHAVGRACVAPDSLGPALVKADCFRLRPRPDVFDDRYVAWFLNSADAEHKVALESRGATRVRATPDAIANISAPVPNLVEQRRIADFLDDHVARIDNVIAARRQQIAMIKATARSQMQDLFDGISTRTRPLATLADARRPIQYGIVLPGPDFPGGVPIVKGGDVAAGRVRSGQLNRTDPEIESRYARSRLRGGDLVISIRGSVGEVDVVPDALTGANLTQDAARIAAFGCDPDWLRWALKLPAVQSDIRRRITGAMVPGINIEALRAVRIPDTPAARQGALGKAAEQVMQATLHHVEGLDRSNCLVQELKRSLMTAAVTGEFDVSSADGSRVSA